MNIKTKGAYHHGDLKQNLIVAAKHLVEKTGNFDFSVSEACRYAGVSTAAPYRHFEDKEDLLCCVAEDGLRQLSEDMNVAAAQHPLGSHEAIHAIGMAYVNFAMNHKGLFRVMFGGAVQSGKYCDRLHEIGEGECKMVVAVQVIAALGNDIKSDIEITSRIYQLWMAVHGMAFLMVENTLEPKDLPQPIDDMLRSTVRLLII